MIKMLVKDSVISKLPLKSINDSGYIIWVLLMIKEANIAEKGEIFIRFI